MKKFLAALALCLTLAQPAAFADSVWTAEERDTNYSLTYPVYENDDPDIKEAINADIYTRASKCADVADNFVENSFSYKLMADTPEYLSFTFISYHMREGAVHGTEYVSGIVYDKKTGRRLPLSHFADVTVEDLIRLHDDERHFMTEDGLVMPPSQIRSSPEPSYVPQEYILTQYGNIQVIFQPYELAPYAYGATRIDVTSLKK